MEKLISALRRFESTDDIEICKLPLEAQKEMNSDILYLRELRLLAGAFPAENPYPMEVWLLPEGLNARLELIGV